MFTTFEGARLKPDIKQDVLLVTDGNSFYRDRTIAAATKLKQIATVYGLAIGLKIAVKDPLIIESYVHVYYSKIRH